MPSRTRRQVAGEIVPASVSSHHELTVNLNGPEPRIWRSLSVPSDYTLADLHDVLQLAMGWTNSHLHQFRAGTVRYCPPDPEDELATSFPTLDSATAHLFEELALPGSSLVYEYDFGDSWEHGISAEAIRPATREDDPPRCLAGARASPPEDCGGWPGYENFLRAIRDPDDPEHDDTLRWCGGWFDPEAFDLEGTNRLLATYAVRRRAWLRGPVPKDTAGRRYQDQRIDLLARILSARDRRREKERRTNVRKHSRGWVLTDPPSTSGASHKAR